MKLLLTKEEKFKILFCISSISLAGIISYFTDITNGHKNKIILLFIPISVLIAFIDVFFCRHFLKKEEL